MNLRNIIVNNDIVALQAAIDAGASLELVDEKNDTPLMIAIIGGNAAILELLLGRGADPNHGATPETPPLLLAAKVHMPLLYDLFSDSAHSAQEPNEPCIELLVKYGADLSRYGAEAACFAVTNQALSTLEALERAGLDFGSTVPWTSQPPRLIDLLLGSALETARPSIVIVRFLLARGADVGLEWNGEPLIVRIVRNVDVDLDALKLLLDSGAPYDTAVADGLTALMIASGMGHSEACRLLIERGAKIDRRDSAGRTALDWAIAGGHDSCLEILKCAASALKQTMLSSLAPDLTEGLRKVGNLLVVSPMPASRTLLVQGFGTNKDDAVAIIDRVAGYSRSPLGPFPIFEILESHSDAATIADPWSEAIDFNCTTGDLIVFSILGTRFSDCAKVRRLASSPLAAAPILVATATFKADALTDARIRLKQLRGFKVIAQLLCSVMTDDGYQNESQRLRVKGAIYSVE